MIRSKINNKVYIGKTKNIFSRECDHKRSLEKGTHYNIYLQKHYNKYSNKDFYSVFSFTIIENNIENIFIGDRERYWISYYRSNNNKYGFNLTIGGEISEWSREVLKRRIKTVRKKYGRRVYCYCVKGNYIGTWNSVPECAEYFNFNRNSIMNALLRGIQLKGYLFFKTKQKNLKPYVASHSRKNVYICVYNEKNNLIDVIFGLKECAEKYSLNVYSLNSRCRRKTVVNNIRFQKFYPSKMWIDMFESFGTEQITLLHIDEKMGELT